MHGKDKYNKRYESYVLNNAMLQKCDLLFLFSELWLYIAKIYYITKLNFITGKNI